MKRLLLAVGTLSLMGLGAWAQAGTSPGTPTGADPFNFWFDEWGNGVIQVTSPVLGPKVSNPGFMAPDPTGRIAGNVLTYALPESVVGGDVIVDEATGGVSDMITFYAGPTTSYMIFYSDAGDAALADVGVPASTSPWHIPELGPEGADYFVYTPGGNAYFGFSDASLVPTPMAAVGALPLLGLMAARRRRA